MPKYVIATFSTWVTPTVHVNRGEIWDASDPVVRSHPDWFDEDPSEHARRTVEKPAKVEEKTVKPAVKPVEQATAAPGEQRAVTKPASK